MSQCLTTQDNLLTSDNVWQDKRATHVDGNDKSKQESDRP